MDINKTLSISLLLLVLAFSLQVGAEKNVSVSDSSDIQQNITGEETSGDNQTNSKNDTIFNTSENDTQKLEHSNHAEVNSSPPPENTSTEKNVSVNKTGTQGNQTGPSAADIQKAFSGWYEKAENASAAGNNKAAADAYAAALRLDKGSEKALAGYGAVLSKLGRDSEALDIYSRLQNISPNNTTILIPLGREQNAIGSHEAALATLLNATTVYPNNTEGWNQLAAAYAGLSRYEEALTTVRKSLQISTDQAGGWGQLGSILSGQGRFYEAIPALEKSLTLDPNDGTTWKNLGDTWMILGHVKEAAQSYEAAIESRPSDTSLWLQLGETYEKLNKTKEAAEAFRKGGVVQVSDTPVNQSGMEPNKTVSKPVINTTGNITGDEISTAPAKNETHQTEE